MCASGGAACHSGAMEPSPVLKAMGIDPQIACGAIRLSLSRYTTTGQIEELLEILPQVLDACCSTVNPAR